MAVFDQDSDTTTSEATSTEVVAGVPSRAELDTVAAPSAALQKLQGDFRTLFASVPWIDSGETAALLAMQIATGGAADAGRDIEAQSVRNLGLVNKVHTITEFACAESSLAGASGPGFYARVSAVRGDGEVFTYSIGGWIPLGQLLAKLTGSAFPWRCQIVATPSKQGNPAYRYVDA